MDTPSIFFYSLRHPLPPPRPPPPQTKMTIKGKDKTYMRQNLIGPFLGPRTPPANSSCLMLACPPPPPSGGFTKHQPSACVDCLLQLQSTGISLVGRSPAPTHPHVPLAAPHCQPHLHSPMRFIWNTAMTTLSITADCRALTPRASRSPPPPRLQCGAGWWCVVLGPDGPGALPGACRVLSARHSDACLWGLPCCACAVRKVGCFPPVAAGPRVLNSAPYSPRWYTRDFPCSLMLATGPRVLF